MKKLIEGLKRGIKKTLAMWYMIIAMGGIWMLLGYLLKIGVQNAGVMIACYLTGACLPTQGITAVGGTIARVAVLAGFYSVLATLFMHKGPLKVKWYYVKKELKEAAIKYNSYVESLFSFRGKNISFFSLGFIGVGFSLIINTFLSGDGRFVNSFASIFVFSAIVGQIVEKRGFAVAVINSLLIKKNKVEINDESVVGNLNGLALGCLIAPFLLLVPVKYLGYYVGGVLMVAFLIVYLIMNKKNRKKVTASTATAIILFCSFAWAFPVKAEAMSLKMSEEADVTTISFANGEEVSIGCSMELIEEAYLAMAASIPIGNGYVTDDIPVLVVPDDTVLTLNSLSYWNYVPDAYSNDEILTMINKNTLLYRGSISFDDVGTIVVGESIDDVELSGIMYGVNMSGYRNCDCALIIPKSMTLLYDLKSSGKRTERYEVEGALIGEGSNKVFVAGLNVDELNSISMESDNGTVNGFLLPIGSYVFVTDREKVYFYSSEYTPGYLSDDFYGLGLGGLVEKIKMVGDSGLYTVIGAVCSDIESGEYGTIYFAPEDVTPELYTVTGTYKIVPDPLPMPLEGEQNDNETEAEGFLEEIAGEETSIEKSASEEVNLDSEDFLYSGKDDDSIQDEKTLRTKMLKETAVEVGIAVVASVAASIVVTTVGNIAESVAIEAVDVKKRRGKLHVNGDINIPEWNAKEKETLEISLNVSEGEGLLWTFIAKPMTPGTKNNIKTVILPAGNDNAVLKLKFENQPVEPITIYLEIVVTGFDIHGERNLLEKMVEIKAV